MSRFFFYYFVLLLFVGCQVKPKAISQTEASICQDFQTGKFKINHKLFGMTTTIVRNDSMQIETTNFAGTSLIFKYKIKWLNDCMYELTPSPNFQNDIDMTDMSSIVKIKKVEGNTMYYKSYRNGKKLRSKSNKMIKTEDD